MKNIKNLDEFINESIEKTKNMIKTKNVKMIDVDDWDNLVTSTYGRPYNFQQQDDCQSRGIFHLSIPSEYTNDNEMNDEIPEVVNGNEMGVKFKKWLERDPKQPVGGETDDWMIELWWERNFYPDIHTVANDLYDKGLIEAGEYTINIDW
jgi:hypothetical protein